MNISVLSLARAGIFAQTVTKKGSCCSRNTSQKTRFWSSFTASLYLLFRNCFDSISNMTENWLAPENGAILKVREEPLFYLEGRHTCWENDSLQKRSSTCWGKWKYLWSDGGGNTIIYDRIAHWGMDHLLRRSLSRWERRCWVTLRYTSNLCIGD